MIPGPLLKPIVAATPLSLQQSARRAQDVDGGLHVTFDDSVYNAETHETTFTGNVKATYGQSTVSAESLSINSEKHTGVASGGVALTDPEGHATAESFEFNWVDKTGTLSGVVLQAVNIHLEAGKLEVQPGQWELTDASLSLSRVGKAPVYFDARSATVYPGKYGIARHVTFHVYGTKIGPIPRLTFSLRKRLKGLGLPSVTNRKGLGVGVSWETNFAAGDHGVISSFWESFPKREPGMGIQYGYSPLGEDSPTRIAPRSDLNERFADGWFNNVSVRTVEEEWDEISSKRSSYAIGTFWNQSTTARPVDSDNVSKSFDLVQEMGGLIHGVGTYGSLRLQSLRDSSAASFVTRATLNSSLIAHPVSVAKGLDGHLRLDTFSSLSENGAYSWGRVETGLIYRPAKGLTFGLGYALGSGVGRPDFSFDGLVAGQSFMARADYMVGPFTFRFLDKYNIDTKQWYDREYEIALVAREFEPYIIYRQFPSETRIGIRFRIDNLRDRLTRRSQDR